MLLSSASAPPPDAARWAYEIKWDGFRVLVRVGGGGPPAIWSRRGTDFTSAFPEMAGLERATGGRSALIDGEMVSFVAGDRTSFASIRRRWGPGARATAARLARSHPATFVAFDLLELDGRSVMAEPYEQRRERLATLQLADRHWLTTAYHCGDGQALLDASKRHGLEGLVAKRLGSRYQPGVRSADWRKIKNYHRASFIIGGWLADSQGRLEALMVGRQDSAGRLAYAGTVEFGLDGRRESLRQLFQVIPAHDSPFGFRGRSRSRIHHVHPRLMAAVRFLGWDARVLREAILERVDLVPAAGGAAATDRR